MLAHLMEKRGLRQVDLVPIIKSRSYVSDIINGKRAISKAHARRLTGGYAASGGKLLNRRELNREIAERRGLR